MEELNVEQMAQEAAKEPEKRKVSAQVWERLKSIPLWASVISLVYLVVKHWIGIEIPGWAEITTEIIAILTILFGAANNPADRYHF